MGEGPTYERRRREFRDRPPTHHCSRCTSVLFANDQACLECGATQPGYGWPSLDNAADPWLGRILAKRYLLTRRIGGGASGNVYRAESMTIGRQFAVKIIALDNQGDSVSPERIEARINREIEALGHLRNPHIVSFYDVVPLDDARAVALVMDLIDGRTLESIVGDDGPMELLRTYKIVRQIANGVHEAHQADMIHRDLKPENIMIERLPAGDDFVHILDFGIVWREGDVHVTQGFLGTPLYASPEQAVGGDLDRRADIYALGGLVFFMLTGQPPFVDDNVYNVLKAHVGTQPPRLSQAAADRQFPDEVEALVHRMLAKSPTDRPQSLAEVIEILDQLTDQLSESPSSRSDQSPQVDDSIDYSPSASPRCTREHPNQTVGGQSTPRGDGDAPGSVGSADADKGDSGFFRSDEWDSTGPKAAILRQRPAGHPTAAGGGQPMTSEADSASFARADALRRKSGLYEIPGIDRDFAGASCPRTAARNQKLLVVDPDNHVLIRDVDGGHCTEFDLPDEPALSAICLANTTVFTGHQDGAVAAWSIPDGASTRLHQNASTARVTSVDCDAAGDWLLFGNTAGGVYLAERQKLALQPLRIQSGSPVRTVAVGARRNMFAVARDDRSICVHYISSPASQVHRFSADEPIENMAFSGDGYLLAVVFADKKLALYHVMTGQVVMRNDQMVEQPLSISFGDNDQLVGYCEYNDRIFGWDLHHNIDVRSSI